MYIYIFGYMLTLSSEGIEDLTGGVSTEVETTDILDRDTFWTSSLMKVRTEFLFGCETKHFRYPSHGSDGRQGIQDGHAYSILRAAEFKGERLLLVKNPWGHGEWKGAWSDGSPQWTSESIAALGHSFGDDGIFWITYEDLLRKYARINRTRLFGDDWSVGQFWTSLAVPWDGGYLEQYFRFEVEVAGPVVIVLSKLDDTYWKGLEGPYEFKVGFRLHAEDEEDYLVRTHGDDFMNRSASVEIDLEAGSYDVLVKLEARRSNCPKVEDVVKQNWLDRREKLISIGTSYDMAHAKAYMMERAKEVVRRRSTSRSRSRSNMRSRSRARTVDSPLDRGRGDMKDGEDGMVREDTSPDTPTSSATRNSQILASTVVDEEEPAQPGNVDEVTPSSPTEGKESTSPKTDAPKMDAESVSMVTCTYPRRPHPLPPPPPPIPVTIVQTASKSSAPEKDAGSWSAVCVVGLRVYSKGPQVDILLFMSDEQDAVVQSRDVEGDTVVVRREVEGEGIEREMGRDVDDPVIDAAKAVEEEEQVVVEKEMNAERELDVENELDVAERVGAENEVNKENSVEITRHEEETTTEVLQETSGLPSTDTPASLQPVERISKHTGEVTDKATEKADRASNDKT